MRKDFAPAYNIADALGLRRAEFESKAIERSIELVMVERVLLCRLDQIQREFPEIRDEAAYWTHWYSSGPHNAVRSPHWADIEHARDNRIQFLNDPERFWGRPY